MTNRSQGHFIKEWRQSMQMTQKEFAAYVGLSPSNYNYLERGEIGYTQTSLEAIAKALEITPAILLSVNPMEHVDDEDKMSLGAQAMRMVEDMKAMNQVLSVDILRAIRGFEARHAMPGLRAKIAARQNNPDAVTAKSTTSEGLPNRSHVGGELEDEQAGHKPGVTKPASKD